MRERRTSLSKVHVVCLETGQSFKSLKDAADSIGRTYQCVSQAAKTGCATNGLHFYYADKTKPDKSFFVMTRDGADGRGGRGRKRPVVCLETSEQFESVSAATKLLNCDGRRLWMALNKGYSIHGLHYYYADKPRPDDSFFQHKRGGHKKIRRIVCLETDEKFESIDDVGAFVGCNPVYIASSIREGFPVKGFHFAMLGK